MLQFLWVASTSGQWDFVETGIRNYLECADLFCSPGVRVMVVCFSLCPTVLLSTSLHSSLQMKSCVLRLAELRGDRCM